MKIQKILHGFLAATALLLVTSAAGAPLPTGFAYQGRLFDAGVPANGGYEMQFVLRDQATGGAAISQTIILDPVGVTNGLFQATLDFGTAAWNGDARWLDVSVRPDNSGVTFTLLSPSQQIQPVPYALFAQQAQQLAAPLANSQLSGTYTEQVFLLNPGNVYAGQGSGLTLLNAGQITVGTLEDARLSPNIPRLNTGANFNGTLTANAFLGDGSGISNVPIATLNGTVADSQLSANVPLLSAPANAFGGNLSATGFTGSGANLSGLNASQLASGTIPDARHSTNVPLRNLPTNEFGGLLVAVTFQGDASTLSNLNAGNLAFGIVPDARISAAIARQIDLVGTSNSLRAQLSANNSSLQGSINNSSNTLSLRLVATNAILVTLITDSSNGLSDRLLATNSALMGKIATASNVLSAAIATEASARAALQTQLTTGDNVFSGSNVFSGFLMISNQASIIFGNGVGLTNLNATELQFGTVADARIADSLARDTELFSVSNSLAGNLAANNSAMLGILNNTSNVLSGRLVNTNNALVTLITGSSNGLSGRLLATDTVLMGKITTTSNALDTAIVNEATARVALQTQL
ncbi:MAG: hypothetical protein ACI91J_000427, partial [Yoonia sp.]